MDPLEIERELVERLRQLHVSIDVPDEHTVCFRGVPADKRRFTKSRTNLLVKRPGSGMPFVVCIDEDLDYTGPDRTLAQAFAGAPRQQGWRVLPLAAEATAGFSEAVGAALRVLGFDGAEPSAPEPGRSGGRLLDTAGIDLTALARHGAAESVCGRAEEIEIVASSLLTWGGQFAIVEGAPGAGKTNLLHGVARVLAERKPEARLIAVDSIAAIAGCLFPAERENILAALFTQAREAGAGLALERFDLAVAEAPYVPYLLADAMNRGLRAAGVAGPGALARFRESPLAGRVVPVILGEPGPDVVTAAVRAAAVRIAAHHGVTIADEVVGAAVARAESLPGALPGRAVRLLDTAAARAALRAAGAVDRYDLYLAATWIET